MRSVCQSLNLLCTAVGSLAAASINAVCAPWIPDDLNRGRLDYVFFLLAALMALNLVGYVGLARRFTPRADAHALLEARRSAARMSAAGPGALLEGGARLSSSVASRYGTARSTAASSSARSARSGSGLGAGGSRASGTFDEALLGAHDADSHLKDVD